MELAQSTDHTFSLDELATAADVPRRTVRYYIELGLLEGAEGETRAARYTRRHLETLRQIRQWTAEGIALSRIKQRLALPQDGEARANDDIRAGGHPVAAAASMTAVRESTPSYVATPSIEVRSHLQLAPGVELVIEPGAARLSPTQMRRFMREALDALARAREEQPE